MSKLRKVKQNKERSRLLTNRLPTVSFAYITFADRSLAYKNDCLQFDCIYVLFSALKTPILFQNTTFYFKNMNSLFLCLFKKKQILCLEI